MTSSASTFRVYLDGSIEFDTTSISGTCDSGILIGNRRAEGFEHKGQTDELGIWNRALSSNEVSTIYNNGAGKFYTP